MEELLLPIFPLEAVLLPEEPLPLHIFEDRYKEMIGECLKAKEAEPGRGEFGVVRALENGISRLGCGARIVNLTRQYEDGKMDIFTIGTRRFEVLFTNQDRAFLRARVEYFEDEANADTPPDAEAGRAIELFKQIVQRVRRSGDIPIHFTRPYRHLSFRIAGSLPLDLEFKQQLLSLRTEGERLGNLTELMEKLIPQFDLIQKVRARAGGNGHGSRPAER